MLIREILIEQYTKEQYGRAEISISDKPIIYPRLTGEDKMFIAKYYHPDTRETFISAGNTRDDARSKVIAQAETEGRIQDVTLYRTFTADLNTQFTKKYIRSHQPVLFKIEAIDGQLYLIQAGQQFLDNFSEQDLRKDGFSKGANRTETIEGEPTAAFVFNVNKTNAINAGLVPFVRYSLDKPKEDEFKNIMWPMERHSTVRNIGDKLRVPVPMLTFVGIR